jgi:hypothetical protein
MDFISFPSIELLGDLRKRFLLQHDVEDIIQMMLDDSWHQTPGVGQQRKI